MYLSKLVYLAIKNVLYQSDSSFTYENFMNGSFDNDIDKSMQINNAFTPLNEAISRLSDLERIPYRYERFSNDKIQINLDSFSKPVKEIIGVYQNGNAIQFKQFGNSLEISPNKYGISLPEFSLSEFMKYR